MDVRGYEFDLGEADRVEDRARQGVLARGDHDDPVARSEVSTDHPQTGRDDSLWLFAEVRAETLKLGPYLFGASAQQADPAYPPRRPGTGGGDGDDGCEENEQDDAERQPSTREGNASQEKTECVPTQQYAVEIEDDRGGGPPRRFDMSRVYGQRGTVWCPCPTAAGSIQGVARRGRGTVGSGLHHGRVGRRERLYRNTAKQRRNYVFCGLFGALAWGRRWWSKAIQITCTTTGLCCSNSSARSWSSSLSSLCSLSGGRF
ncbi:hypothetical protein GCM10027614_19800 [Micromonospora vulcania]